MSMIASQDELVLYPALPGDGPSLYAVTARSTPELGKRHCRKNQLAVAFYSYAVTAYFTPNGCFSPLQIIACKLALAGKGIVERESCPAE